MEHLGVERRPSRENVTELFTVVRAAAEQNPSVGVVTHTGFHNRHAA